MARKGQDQLRRAGQGGGAEAMCTGSCRSPPAADGASQPPPSASLCGPGSAGRGLCLPGRVSGRPVRSSAPTLRDTACLKAHEQQKGRQRHGQPDGEGSTRRRVGGRRILELFVRRGVRRPRRAGCEIGRVGRGLIGQAHCWPGFAIRPSHHCAFRQSIRTGCCCRILLRSGPVSQKRDQCSGREPDRPTRHTAYPYRTPASVPRPVSILAVRRPC
ncbi:hypothetical protein CESP606_14930 [Cereibacter sphaeroides]